MESETQAETETEFIVTFNMYIFGVVMVAFTDEISLFGQGKLSKIWPIPVRDLLVVAEVRPRPRPISYSCTCDCCLSRHLTRERLICSRFVQALCLTAKICH